MDNIYIYCVDMPPNVHEMVTPCLDGFTIYLDIKEDEITAQKRLEHALRHIADNDFDKTDVQDIEANSHKEVQNGK